jgi:hypothetical protein
LKEGNSHLLPPSSQFIIDFIVYFLFSSACHQHWNCRFVLLVYWQVLLNLLTWGQDECDRNFVTISSQFHVRRVWENLTLRTPKGMCSFVQTFLKVVFTFHFLQKSILLEGQLKHAPYLNGSFCGG